MATWLTILLKRLDLRLIRQNRRCDLKKILKSDIVRSLEKARVHLETSFNKVKRINLEEELSDSQLETLESFSSRFARFSDLIISKYLRALALELDPAFRGSVIDLLNVAEKNDWIDSTRVWIRVRELRNIAAHEYEAEDYKELYSELVQLAPSLLSFNFSQ